MQLQFTPSSDGSKGESQPPECIPVFPLPNVVFFPRTYLPLHIFEPRYRQMVADAADAHQCVGMALLKDGWEEDYYGNPPIFEVGCLGRLVSVQSLPDGRYNVLLEGMHRFRVCREFYDRSYRQARVELQPAGCTAVVDATVKVELIRSVKDYLMSCEEGASCRELLDLNVNDEIFVNGLATYLEFSPLEKQFLLEADSLVQRTRRLTDLLRFKVHERDGAKGWS
jgi:Lon protease-like protein